MASALPWLWAVLALMAGLVAILAMHAATRFYAEARAAAVFPDRTHRFAAENRTLLPKRGKRIVLFGDSRVVQWVNFPSEQGAEVIFRGVSGETSAQMRARFDQDVLALDPDTVVLQLGINDLVAIGVLSDRRAEIVGQCAETLNYFVETLGARKIRVILLTIIPPARPALWRRPFWDDAIATEVELLNRNWMTRPAPTWLHVVDTRAALQDETGNWRPNAIADTLHLTPRGYDYLNAVVAPLLRD
jgi:lysophospholipase L1-like esterase